MDFDSTKGAKHKDDASRVEHIGHMAGCVATSWEAACNLLLETKKEKTIANRRRRLLELSSSPIVWTFVAGNFENRTSFANGVEGEVPQLIGLVSGDAGLGFQGIAEADYLYDRLGRERGVILPSDIFVFSINTDEH